MSRTESDQLVHNMIMDTFYSMLSDKDRAIGQFKAKIRKYFEAKKVYDRDQDLASYEELKEAERELQQIANLTPEPKCPVTWYGKSRNPKIGN